MGAAAADPEGGTGLGVQPAPCQLATLFAGPEFGTAAAALLLWGRVEGAACPPPASCAFKCLGSQERDGVK